LGPVARAVAVDTGEGRGYTRAVNDRAYTRAQRLGLLASLLAQAISATYTYSLPPLATLVQSDLGLTRAELGLMLSVASFGTALIALPGGWLADFLGVRRVVFVGIMVGGVSFCALSLTGSLVLSLLLLLLIGMGLGVIPAATTKAVMLWFTVRVRGTAMGIKQTGFPLGGALTAGLLPSVALALGGWRPAMAAVGLEVIVGGVLYLWLYVDHPADAAAGGQRPPGLLAMRSVLAEPRLLALAALGFCYAYSSGTLTGYLSLYLQESLGMWIVTAGIFLMGCQVSGATARLAFGFISDRFFGGRRAPMLLVVTAAHGVLALIFGWLPSLGPSAQAVLILAFGATAIGWSSLYHVFVAEVAGRKQAGTAIGLCMMAMSGGGVVGPPVFGYIVDASHSYQLAWASQTVLASVGVAILWWVRRRAALMAAAAQQPAPSAQ
jgi:MFS transporter, ACS family, hexuronate transporter